MLNILIIDDDSNARFFIEQILKRTFRVPTFQANNGKEALAILESQEIDVICLDLNMPKMNGIDFINQIKNSPSFKQYTIIIMSSENEKSIIANLLQLGIRNFILKPFEYTETQTRLKNIIIPLLKKKKDDMGK